MNPWLIAGVGYVAALTTVLAFFYGAGAADRRTRR